MMKYKCGRTFLIFVFMLRYTKIWRESLHKLYKHGVKNSPSRFVSRLTSPLKPASEKRYLICAHPHGLLVDGWHIAIAKSPNDFAPETHTLGGIPNMKPYLCASPIIRHVPGHQELFRERCGGAAGKDIEYVLKNTDCNPTLCPGGFAESVFCWSDGKKEYSWLKNNSRFIQVAIKNKTDIIPTYSYGNTSMYRTNTWFRQQFAELSQKYQIPLVPFWGKLLAYPLHDDVVTVVYDPFPVDKYSVDDAEQALLDYQAYLKKCFDEDKAKYGMADKELTFIGPRNIPKKKSKAAPPQIRSKL